MKIFAKRNTNSRRTRRGIRAYSHDQGGVATVEFALCVPFLCLLLLGGVELGRYLLIHQKVGRMAFSLADITSQFETLTNNEMTTILNASSHLMNPRDNFAIQGRIIISSVEKGEEANDVQEVVWQCAGGGNLDKDSTVGTVNSENAATLPNSLSLESGEDVIVAEVFYTYTPMLTWGGLANPTDVVKTALFRPRLGALTTSPGCT